MKFLALLLVVAGCVSSKRGTPTEVSQPASKQPIVPDVKSDVRTEPPAEQGRLFRVVVVGDIGLNRDDFPVKPDGMVWGNEVYPWAKMTEKIEELLDGDLNIGNLETVVSDRSDLPVESKRQKSPYSFVSHPNGVRHLVKIGFNVFSLANNHSYDYGEEGVRETVKFASKFGVPSAGVGLDREAAAKPAVFEHDRTTVAFAAVGIVTNMLKSHRAGENKPGQLGYRYKEDWDFGLRKLVESEGQLKILSIHYGRERKIKTDARQLKEWRQAAEDGVHLVMGHHAHVVRGIQMHKGVPIFYGLGNFLLRGAANMGAKPKLRVWGDYGLLGKVTYWIEKGVPQVLGIEVVPIWDMHVRPRKLSPKEATKRMEVLNVLGSHLNDKAAGSVGVQFRIRQDGSGLYCTVLGKEKLPACNDWQGPTPPSSAIRKLVERQLR